MRSFWIYTLARLGIIVAVGLVLQPFLGFTLVMAVAAIFIGALISYLVLGGMRAKVAGDIENRLAKRAKTKKRKGQDESFEDTLVDENVSAQDAEAAEPVTKPTESAKKSAADSSAETAEAKAETQGSGKTQRPAETSSPAESEASTDSQTAAGSTEAPTPDRTTDAEAPDAKRR